jgi:hypothetical protein
VAIFEDFEEITLLEMGERRKSPIIQDQELDAPERLEKPGVATIATRERQGLEEPGNALIEHAPPVPAGLVAERAGDPAFADPCRPCDQKSFGARDPIASDELLEERAIDATRGAQIDGLDDGVLAQRGELEAGGDALGVAVCGFAIDDEAEPFFERKSADVVRSPLVLEGPWPCRSVRGR